MINQRVTNVLNSIETFKKKEDGTYNILTGEDVTYCDGYQVSFVRPEAFEQLSSQDWDNMTNYFCTKFDSKAHIGVYCHSAEVSFRCISFDEAKKTMEAYNQESMLDWRKKSENPDLPESWFYMNRFFDKEKVIKYGKILNEIQ